MQNGTATVPTFCQTLPRREKFNLSQQIKVTTAADARYKIDQLNSEIEHITGQIEIAKLRDQAGEKKIDSNWLRKAIDSCRYRREEAIRLLHFINASKERLNNAIVEVVRHEFDDAEWSEIIHEAKSKIGNGDC